MAKPSWLVVAPSAGSGNGQIQNSASPHTGRVAREGDVTVTGAGVADPEVYHVIQTAKEEFVTLDNGAEMAVSKDGGNVTITGKSNSAKLKFEWVVPEGKTQPEHDADGNEDYAGEDFPEAEIPASYTAAGKTTNNDAEIDGDPGAEEEYDYSIDIEFPKNDFAVEVLRTLKVTANGSQVAQIVVKQTAQTATLEVSPKSITIPQAGTAVSVEVTSNTSWTVS